jgi:hypothetical protein
MLKFFVETMELYVRFKNGMKAKKQNWGSAIPYLAIPGFVMRASLGINGNSRNSFPFL